ncbi:SDR family NAD(P)-dependent oxidoreductase [Sphingomonas ginkgonis]|uniref:SDR family NAD(P)-dependent oxidoreductase n=1 Tax=Sphingomonas ginkgonis TaxID=2315330 RepID=A0A429VAS1_9SPHN|nr:SDR family oxidoreductase [Sphingomonas ginkgonis]RST31046.1 SDR family NAD(P)-dependent oxidoreductase [Sphingomonas ginkgonis]
MKTSGNTILITGGGSGIGRALARRFHDRGDRVIVAGRRREALEETAAGRDGIAVMTLDVGQSGAVDRFARALLAEHPEVNVLINNAGIMPLEKVGSKRDLKDVERVVETNLLGPIRLIDALVDHLAGRPDSAIVNVTSGLAYVPLIAAPTYSATKAAIHSYTVALRQALKERVEVIELVPPGVQTGLTPGQEQRPGYMPLDEFADEVMSLFGRQPTPGEILVERVKFQRDAEAEGRFDRTLIEMNQRAEAARAAQPEPVG